MKNKLIPGAVFAALFPRGNKIVQLLLNKILPDNGISSLSRVSSFLAQCGHESVGFTKFEENLNYSATGLLNTFGKYFDYTDAVTYERRPEMIANRVYANRMGNGSEESGDGWRYRGRGIIQLTGKENYQKFANYKGISLEQCENYLDTIQGKVESGVWFWNTNNCNIPSDSEDIRKVTKIINGGYNGLEERESLFSKAKQMLSDFLGTGDDFSGVSVHNKPRIKISKDFYRDQFECDPIRCGCGTDFVDYGIVEFVQNLYESLNRRKINIISGTRCESYNKIVGNPGSMHIFGRAVDIEVPEDEEKKLPELTANEIIKVINGLDKKIYTYPIDKKRVHADNRTQVKPNSIKVIRNITRADIINNGVDSLDIASYFVLKTLDKIISRDFKIINFNSKTNRMSKSILFQIPKNKTLPPMKSKEIIGIITKIYGNLVIVKETNEYTVFLNTDGL